jgi:periplasmic divalent cation tolerance protein
VESSDETIIVYTTFPNEEDARKLGGELVEERLAACVNIFPGMVSIYRWQDNIETAHEAAMIIKTRKSLKDEVFAAVASRHPYSVPALLMFEPSQVAAPYNEWLFAQTRTAGKSL